MSDATRRRWSLVLNTAIVVMTAFAWCQMMFGWGWEHAPLSGLGLTTLKYFTIQSNLLSAVTSAVCVTFYLQNRDQRLPDWAHTLRFVATTAVTLTLVTVEAFLSPMLYGYASMHAGANLWFHLLLPLMAIVSLCVFEADRPLLWRTTLVAIIPMVLYGAGYLANILINGIGEGPATNDWYGFTAWGMERIPIVFIVMMLVTWLIATVLRAVNQRVWRARKR